MSKPQLNPSGERSGFLQTDLTCDHFAQRVKYIYPIYGHVDAHLGHSLVDVTRKKTVGNSAYRSPLSKVNRNGDANRANSLNKKQIKPVSENRPDRPRKI
jgi:hypothetical protein